MLTMLDAAPKCLSANGRTILDARLRQRVSSCILRAEPNVHKDDRNHGRMQGLDLLGDGVGRHGDVLGQIANPPR